MYYLFVISSANEKSCYMMQGIVHASQSNISHYCSR